MSTGHFENIMSLRDILKFCKRASGRTSDIILFCKTLLSAEPDIFCNQKYVIILTNEVMLKTYYTSLREFIESCPNPNDFRISLVSGVIENLITKNTIYLKINHELVDEDQLRGFHSITDIIFDTPEFEVFNHKLLSLASRLISYDK